MDLSRKTKAQLVEELKKLQTQLKKQDKSTRQYNITQSALQESKERYRKIVETLTDYIFTVRIENGKPVETIHGYACEAVTGYTSEEFSKDPYLWIGMVPQEDHEIVRMQVNDILENHRADPIEHRIVRKDGTLRWVKNTPVLHFSVEGELTSYDGLIHDITEKRQVEDALQESEKRFQQVAENMQEWIWEVNPEGLYTYASPTVEVILGYKPEEVINKKHFYDLFPDEIREEFTTAAFEVFAQKKSFREFINKNINKNGETVWLSTNGVAKLDKQGNLIGYIGSDIDITERKITEDALKESEEKYRSIVDSATLGIITTNIEGEILYINNALLKMFEFETSEEVMKRNALTFYKNPNDRKAIIEKLISNKRVDNQEVQLITKTGKIKDVLISMALTDNILSGIILDISKRKAAEKALSQSEERFRLLAENIPGVIYLCKNDERYTMLYLNDKVEELTGYPKEDFITDKISFVELYHPDDAPYIQPKVEQAISERRPFHLIYRLKHSTGIWSWIEEYGSGVFDDNDKLMMLEGFLIDISEKKRAEDEAESLRNLSRELTKPLTRKEIGQIIAKESRELFDHDAFDLSYFDKKKGISVEIYFEDTPKDSDKPIEMKTGELPFEAIEESNTYKGESILINREEGCDQYKLIPAGDKSRISQSLMFAPIKWADQVIGVLSVQSYTQNKYNKKDLHLLEGLALQCGGALLRVQVEEEQKIFEAQVQQAQKLESLGVLAGGIAHDFNNLLMGILGSASLALTEISPVSPAKESIEQIEKSSQRAAELCKQMLAYSGKGRFVIQPIDLTDLVEDMIHLMEISISKKATLKYNLDRNLPAIEVDATQIRQVVMNLITNASDAIGDTMGVISITTGTMECSSEYLKEIYIDKELPEGIYVYIEVSDTGCGMESEAISKIFDPFFTTKFTGRGLGLAAVLGIVRGHKGALKVYSEPGKGTTFRILFPSSKKEVAQSKKGKIYEDKWLGCGTILVIDDEDIVREVAKQMIESIGFKVLTASNGVEGVKVFRENNDVVTAVLLDMTMPYMDGAEAFRELKKIKNDVCVILSSGYNEQDATSSFAGKGLAGFIQKPFQIGELRKILKMSIESLEPNKD